MTSGWRMRRPGFPAARGGGSELLRHGESMAAIKVAVTGQEYQPVAAQLPDDYAGLLGTEPVHHY
jgi:hypothetical protein